jgi:hypothetical protein
MPLARKLGLVDSRLVEVTVVGTGVMGSFYNRRVSRRAEESSGRIWPQSTCKGQR